MLPPPGFRDVVLAGAGATSRVFRATSARTGRTVALKRLHRQLARAPEALSRLRRELQALGRLQHGAIVPVLDVIRWQGDPTIVMEYVPGRDLGELIGARGPLSFAEAERILRALLDVLHVAHGAGIVHRDVKPQNVRIAEDGRVFLLDFGSARLEASSQLTATGTSVGTPEYMAPELFAGTVYDPRADLYGAGATVFQVLTGRPPQTADSLSELAFRRTNEDAPPVRSLREGTPEHLAQVIDRCLARAPEDRHASAAHALWALDHPDAERRFAARRSRLPPCLHCGAAIAPESNVCPACGSDHPFCFGPGQASVTLTAIRDPSPLAAELVSTFPELASDGLTHLSERLAAVGTAPQRIVSLVHRDEAIAFADRLREAGAECEISEDPGVSRWKLRGPFLYGVLLILALITSLSLLVPFAPLAILMLLPAAAALLADRALALDRASHGLLSSRALVSPPARTALAAGAPLLAAAALALPAIDRLFQLGLHPGLAPALLGGAVVTAAAAAAARFFRFSRKRKAPCGSPEPGALDRLRSAFSVPGRPLAHIQNRTAGLLVVAVLALVPAELAAAAVLRSVVPTFWSLWSATEISLPSPGPSSWEPAPSFEPLADPVLEEPLPPEPPAELQPIEPLRPIADPPEPLLPPWLDATSGSIFGSIVALDLLLLAFMLVRRRRFARDGSRLVAELELPPVAKDLPRSRAPARLLSEADRIAERRTGDAFLEAAKQRVAELAHHLDPDDVDRLSRSLEQGEARVERSFVARCILESDSDLALRFELLRMAGRMEAKAAERWASSLPEER